MVAYIYKLTKTATQSGRGRSVWILKYEVASPQSIEPLMGYTSSRDAQSQIKLVFPSLEMAASYAQKHNIHYQVEKAHANKRRVISYSDNFSATRVQPWTH